MTDTNRRIAELLEPEPSAPLAGLTFSKDWAWRRSIESGGNLFTPRNFSGSWADAGWLNTVAKPSKTSTALNKPARRSAL
jgi:hypothetical protein